MTSDPIDATATLSTSDRQAQAPDNLRRGLRTLGKGLVVYGIIGCILTIVGLAAALLLAGRLTAVADRVSPQLETVSETIDSTIAALENASMTSLTFATTLETTAPALGQAASTVTSIQPQLAAVGSSLGAFSILGAQPLAQAGALFSGVAGTLSQLGSNLEVVSASLSANQASLVATSASLDRLAESLAKSKDQLASGEIEQSLADLIQVFLIALVVIVLFLAVPAVTALLFGLRLLRTSPAGTVAAAPEISAP
jgi:hypothetical protein